MEVKAITEARRAVIIRTLGVQSGPVTLDELLALLGALHQAGQWPQASWKYARNEPYYTGVYQHLGALERQGRVERVDDPNQRTLWKCARTLSKHAAEVLALKEAGLSGTEIATRVGLSRSRVSSLLTDPYGEKERRRKAGYCPGCGKKKEPDAVVCRGCIARKEKKDQADREAMLPTGEEAGRILDTFAAERRAGREAVLGVAEDFKRIIRWRTARGVVEHVLRRDESWTEGMQEIGLWTP